MDWTPWENAKVELEKNLQPAKEQIAKEHSEFLQTPKGIKAASLGRSFFSAISEELEELIDFYVIQGNPHDWYERSEEYDEAADCVIIKHGLLDRYIGKYYAEIVAAKEFLNPEIEIDSAVLVRHLSAESSYSPPKGAKYVIEHVYRGEMHVLYDNTPDYMRLGMYRPLLAHGYEPGIDGPRSKLVYKNLETVVFTFK